MPERRPLLDLSGPLTVKEVEQRVFHAARSDPSFEASPRTWLEEDRSYFIRWREGGSRLMVVGLVHVFALPEMASRVTVLPFEEQSIEPLRRYGELLRGELSAENFA